MNRKSVNSPTSDWSWSVALNGLLLVFSLAILIMVGILLNKSTVSETATPVGGLSVSATGPGSATQIGSTTCDDGNTCTLDYSYVIEGRAVCNNYNLPTNTTCEHQCLIPESGLCLMGKCKGLCSGYCPYYLDFDPGCPNLGLRPDIQTAVDNEDLFFGQLCFYGKCVYSLESPINPAFTCALADSLDLYTDYVPDTPGCLSFLDQTDIVSSCIKASTLCVDGGYPICIYQYACSNYDIYSPEQPSVFGSKVKSEKAEVSNLAIADEEHKKESEVHNKTKGPKKNMRGKALKPKKTENLDKEFTTQLDSTEIVKIRKAFMNSVHARKHKTQKRTAGDTVALGDLTVLDAKMLVYESLGGASLDQFIAANVVAARLQRNSTV